MSKIIQKVFLTFLIISIKSFTNGTIQLFVPFYFYPYPDSVALNQVIKSSESLSVVVALNTGSSQPDGNYTSAIRRLNEGGVHLLGYINTFYGTRDINEVIDEINKYTEWNSEKLNGVLIDQGSNELNKLDYYKRIYNSAHSKFGCRSKTFLNVGTHVDEVFFGDEDNKTADTIIIFEDDYDAWTKYTFDSYTRNRADSELCALIHSCPKENMQDAVDRAISNNVGFIYVTDKHMNNPYDSLPTYFDDLVAYMATK